MGLKFTQTLQCVLTDLGVSPEQQNEIVLDLEQRYSEPARHYHTLTHLEHLFGVLEEYRDLAKQWHWVILAAAYHDVVYDPHASDNEEKSAQLAAEVLIGIGVGEDIISQVSAMILATKTHESRERNIDQELLLDADLSILGSRDEQYDEYVSQIEQEYLWVPAADYVRGRTSILRTLLDRKRLFITEEFHQRFEERARANLTREIERLADRAS
jgi:predicted metal-dependent HD superfamily phosphohydrolase